MCSDSDCNLLMKILFGMPWTVTNCPRTRFTVKVDQDTFVNLDLLMDDALLASGTPSFVLGYHHLLAR